MNRPDIATFTAEDVAHLLALYKHRVYSLEQVHEMTGFSLRSLELACRRGQAEHIRDGKTIGMTLDQVDLLVASRRKGKTELPSDYISASDEAQALEMSRRNASRGSRQAFA